MKSSKVWTDSFVQVSFKMKQWRLSSGGSCNCVHRNMGSSLYHTVVIFLMGYVEKTAQLLLSVLGLQSIPGEVNGGEGGTGQLEWDGFFYASSTRALLCRLCTATSKFVASCGSCSLIVSANLGNRLFCWNWCHDVLASPSFLQHVLYTVDVHAAVHGVANSPLYVTAHTMYCVNSLLLGRLWVCVPILLT